MAARTPITEADKARILQLHAQGMSRNDIARETGRGAATVTRVVTAAGLTFDRTATAAATAARQADAAAMRAELEITYLEKAKQLLAQIDQPHLAFNFGGKDNTYEEHQLDKPPVRDIRDLMQSASIATTASLRIDQHRNDNGMTAAVSLVDRMLDHFGLSEESAPDESA